MEDLIQKLIQYNIGIDVVDNQLKLIIPCGVNANEIIKEVRQNKEELLSFLREMKSQQNRFIRPLNKYNDGTNDSHIPDSTSDAAVYRGEYYYPVTPVQIYWINDHKDTEFKQVDATHGYILKSWFVNEKINPIIFKMAVAYVVRRHESLRATFHIIDGKYLMKVGKEDSSLYEPDIRDLRNSPIPDEELNRIADLRDCRMNLEKGPLFLTRLIQLDNEKYILSIKLHHSISDALSLEILQRDLLTAYMDLSQGKQPSLPVLKYHLKEYLKFINDDARRNYDSHKKYWNDLYDHLPHELIIPGAKKNEGLVDQKICKIEEFQIPAGIRTKMDTLAKEFSVSLFVIIQATFKAFLRYITGQTDIVIGTFVFGRNYPGVADQIGCYARTVLIRTIVDNADSFHDIILKVKQANEDMQTYTAYTLMNACEAMLPDKANINGSFWKINLQYEDLGDSFVEQGNLIDDISHSLGIDFTDRVCEKNSHIPIDMSLQFFCTDKNLDLSIHFDSSTYDSSSIRIFAADYLAYAKLCWKN